MEKTDQELVQGSLLDEEGSFNLIVKRYSGQIYGFITRLVGSRAAAEDLTQEVFLRVWKKLNAYDPKQSFKAWIFRIARNASIDWLRKKKTIPFSNLETAESGEYIEESIPDMEPLQEELFEKKEIASMLEGIMQKLSEDYRAVLLLHYVNDMTFQEIAESLNRPMNTVKSQHRRALVALKALIDERYAPDRKV